MVVTRGHIEARKSDSELRALFGPGSLACGAVCFGHADTCWSAVAAGPSEVLTVAVEDVFERLEDHLDGMRALMATLSLERERLCEELASQTGELVL